MNYRQIIGMVGSIILMIGVFAPIMSAPLIGDLNYFQNGKGGGGFIFILAIISLVLVFLKKYKGLWITGSLTNSILLFIFLNYKYEVYKINEDATGGTFQDLDKLVVSSIQLEWGLALLSIGGVLVFCAACGHKATDILGKDLSEKTSSISTKQHIELIGKTSSIPPILLSQNTKTIVGRSGNVDISLNNVHVSRKHLSLQVTNDKEIVLTDLNSSNGTYIGGRRLLPNVPTVLNKGEQVIIGSEDIVYTYL